MSRLDQDNTPDLFLLIVGAAFLIGGIFAPATDNYAALMSTLEIMVGAAMIGIAFADDMETE